MRLQMAWPIPLLPPVTRTRRSAVAEGSMSSRSARSRRMHVACVRSAGWWGGSGPLGSLFQRGATRTEASADVLVVSCVHCDVSKVSRGPGFRFSL